MRVITGTCRGRRLKEPEGMEIRPTADQVKEGLFNIIQFDVEGRKVLDLFSGTGQLGIEALSRGAASCTFCDISRKSLKLTEDNLKLCGLTGRTLLCDGVSYLKCGEKYDLIFLDPPYGKGLDAQAMQAVMEFDNLSNGGIMIIESRPDSELPMVPPEYGTVKAYRYGKIRLTVVTRRE